jgi:hypothetical protein
MQDLFRMIAILCSIYSGVFFIVWGARWWLRRRDLRWRARRLLELQFDSEWERKHQYWIDR